MEIHRKRKAKNQANKFASNIPAEMQEYHGALDLRGAKLQKDLTLGVLQYNAPLTSTGGGLINSVFGLDISLFNNYTNYTNSYDEFRLLKAVYKFVPDYENAVLPLTTTTSALGAPIVGVIDRDNSSAPTSYNIAEYASAEIKSVNKPMTLIYEMSGSEDAGFIGDTSLSSAWFRLFGSGLSGSTTFGQVFVKALFQFRGRT
jgi:hypothetical protein